MNLKSIPRRNITLSFSSFNGIINEQAKELGITTNNIPKLYKLSLMKHITEVIIVTIRSELIRYKKYKRWNAK